MAKSRKKALEELAEKEDREAEKKRAAAQERKRLTPVIAKLARMGASKAAICKKIGWTSKAFYTDEHRWALDLWQQRHDEYVDVRVVTDEYILNEIAKKQQSGEPLEQWEVQRIERARAELQRNAERVIRQRLENRRKALELEILKVQLEREKRSIKEAQEDCLVQLIPMTEEDERRELSAWAGDEYMAERTDVEEMDNEGI